MSRIPQKFDVLIVALLAFTVRLVYVTQLSATPFFDAPIVDAGFHDAWARDIIDKGIGHEGPYFRAPLYPYFLAAVYALSNGSYLAARLAQALLGTATAIFTYLLAYQLLRRRSIALIAGIGCALYGILVYFDGELLVETLFIPLLLAALWAYAWARTDRHLIKLLVPGLLLGLAIVTRPSALVVLPVLLIDQMLLREESAAGQVVSRLIRSFILLTACFLPILPVTWHNVYQGGDFVLVGSSGGVNFYIGYNPQSDGLHSLLPDIGTNWDLPRASLEAYKAEGRILKSSEVSDYYYRLGRDYILHHPLDAAQLTLRKFAAFWHRQEISNNRDLYFFKNETLIMPYLRWLGFWLVAPLGLLGFWISWRRKLLPGWFHWVLVLYMLSVVAFFVTARFRAPLIPLLLILAALALTDFADRSTGLITRSKIINLALLTGLFLFVNINFAGIHPGHPAHAHFCLGNAFLKKGDLEGAKKAYHWALKVDSTYALTHLNLGVVAYNEGNFELAEEEYRRELEINPTEAMVYNNLGVLRFNENDFREAKAYYEKALELQPYFDDARVNLAECYFKIGLGKAADSETTAAAQLFRQALELSGNNALYHYNYALAMGRLGYQESAVKHLRITLELAPSFDEARQLLNRIEQLTQSP